MLKKNQIRLMLFTLIVFSMLFCSTVQAFSLFKKKPEKPELVKINAAQLQSQVMAFADRYVSIIQGAFTVYREQEPSPDNYKYAFFYAAYSMSSAYTIASESNPAGALLDMTTMVTLGRMVFEENIQEKIGPKIEPVIEGFRKAETDIWQILTPLLTPEKKQYFHTLIENWRKKNPEVEFFPTVRFNNFSSFRGISDMDEQDASGLFKSVEQAVEQVEETRLLAERGMYLATRMPMLTGSFGGVWFSQLAQHPDMEKILDDINRVSQVSERLAIVAETLPDRISMERDITIKQAMENITELSMMTIDETSKKTLVMIDETAKRLSLERQEAINQLTKEISAERKRITQDLINEEERITGVLSELRLTLTEGNKLMVTTDSMIKELNLGSDSEKSSSPSEPFNIIDYKNTIAETTNLILQIHDLVKTLDSIGFKKMLPEILSAVETFEQKGEKWVYFGFLLGVALIGVFLTGLVVASLIYRYLANRMFGPKMEELGSN